MKRILLVAVVVLLAILAGSALMVKSTKSEPSEFEALALRVDKLLDSLPEQQFDLFEPILWIYEVVPYFYYEGLTSNPVYPEGAQYALFGNGMANFHILGKAQCDRDGGGPIFLNARGLNTASPWFAKPWLLPTLVHELIHAQGGGFCSGDTTTLESTTQMATLEVLAAMANHGNRPAAYALLDELRDMAMSAAYYEALRDNEPERYTRLRNKIHDNPFDRARAEKSGRFWNQTAQSRVNLKDILNKYSFIPLSRALEGVADECSCIQNLYLGEWVEPGPHYGPPVDRFAARSLDVDDLAWFLQNMEAVAARLLEESEEEQ